MNYFLAFGITILIIIVFMPQYIKFLKKIGLRQVEYENGLADFKAKEGTPIMGGVSFVVVPIIVFIVLNPSFYKDPKLVLIIMSYLGYGLIGFLDDYIVVVKHNNDGLLPRYKFGLQLLLSIIFYLIYSKYCVNTVTIPFINLTLDLGFFYAILVFLMFTGSSNAVNLTDGMDGLAAGVSSFAVLPFIYFCYKQNQIEMAVLLFAVLGGLLGYLKYNHYPAKIFMGDSGSLALGGLFAAYALVLKEEIALIIIGGVFVIETICVLIQQFSVRLFHKKVFIYTPIHYAFRLKGMKETNIVKMFYLGAFVFCILGFLIGVFE